MTESISRHYDMGYRAQEFADVITAEPSGVASVFDLARSASLRRRMAAVLMSMSGSSLTRLPRRARGPDESPGVENACVCLADRGGDRRHGQHVPGHGEEMAYATRQDEKVPDLVVAEASRPGIGPAPRVHHRAERVGEAAAPGQASAAPESCGRISWAGTSTTALRPK